MSTDFFPSSTAAQPLQLQVSDTDAVKLFGDFLAANVAVPVAAMNTLVAAIKTSNATTWMQLEQELRATIADLKTCTQEDLGGRTNISLGSGCDLFMKYVTRAFNMEIKEFKTCKDELLRRGAQFADISLSARAHIAEIGHSFIQEGNTVLIHGISRVVTTLLLLAARNTHFNVIATEGRPGNACTELALQLSQAGIPVHLVPDSAVGVFMENVHMCLVGAEGVMENGGIINKVGTFQVALVANALQKPFYVAVESYKFARMYPLSQRDMLQMVKSQKSSSSQLQEEVADSNGMLTTDTPNVDFTPAKLITLLFTDLGVLTPAAVSDELIRLYQ